MDNWDNITETNVDKVAEELEKLETSATTPKKKRGRPAKARTPDAPIPAPKQSEEEEIPSDVLASMFYKSPPSTPGRKSPKPSVKFTQDEEEQSLSERLDHEVLLKIYDSFFKEPLASRHNRRKKLHDENTPKHVLERDVKELQRCIGTSDPANDLGHGWAKLMTLAEKVAIMQGLPLWGLGEEAEKRAKDPEFTDTFRELLIKYPRLRSYMVMGGFPELRLAVLSMYMAGSVAERNIQELANLKRPERETSASKNGTR